MGSRYVLGLSRAPAEKWRSHDARSVAVAPTPVLLPWAGEAEEAGAAVPSALPDFLRFLNGSPSADSYPRPGRNTNPHPKIRSPRSAPIRESMSPRIQESGGARIQKSELESPQIPPRHPSIHKAATPENDAVSGCQEEAVWRDGVGSESDESGVTSENVVGPW